MCLNGEAKYGAMRHIRWEKVLKLYRSYNSGVTEKECPVDSHLRTMVIKLKQIEGGVNETLSQLASVTALKKQLEQTKQIEPDFT